ncbi:MAG: STAS domain-containing protein [Verrucomicrobia bacterium]|nr:STAS domain-containing protein [Verrucomicrobiota bacterium]
MQIELNDYALRVTFPGDLLSTNVTALRTELLAHLDKEAAATTVIADLSNAKVVDSQGLNLLIALLRETERRKLKFRVENPHPEIRRMFTLLNLNTRFALVPAA